MITIEDVLEAVKFTRERWVKIKKKRSWEKMIEVYNATKCGFCELAKKVYPSLYFCEHLCPIQEKPFNCCEASTGLGQHDTKMVRRGTKNLLAHLDEIEEIAEEVTMDINKYLSVK